MIRHIELEGGYNVRDLGGYATEDGRTTRWNTLIRAGSLEKLTVTAQQMLIASEVKTVIDLRDESEVTQFPSVFALSAQVRYLNLPLLGEQLHQDASWPAEKDNYVHLHELYCKYLERCQSQIGTIIGAIADSTPATIFNCFAGKDRTGIVCALLLGVAGVPDHVIAEDYSLSSQGIAHLVIRWHERAVRDGRDLQRFERDVASEANTMIETLKYIRQQYGDASGYLRVCGITEGQFCQLRTKLVG